MKIVNIVSAFIVLALFAALVYTVPKAILTFGIAEIKMVLLNVFYMIWFGLLFKTTKGENENGG